MNKNLVNNIDMKCAGNFLNRQNMPFCKQKVHSTLYISLKFIIQDKNYQDQ